jgi:hypothetical protein
MARHLSSSPPRLCQSKFDVSNTTQNHCAHSNFTSGNDKYTATFDLEQRLPLSPGKRLAIGMFYTQNPVGLMI